MKRGMMDFKNIKIAFFSMEVGIGNSIHTYAGGLGILSGDALRSCADLKLPVAGVTLLYKKGYFSQKIADDGSQIEEDHEWDYESKLKRLDSRVKIRIAGDDVHVGAWLFEIEGVKGSKVPLLFLDTDLEENSGYARQITSKIYHGDMRMRLAQEMVLGIGGIEILKSLECSPDKYHMNEGHSALLTLALCRESKTGDVLNEVRGHCIFTTHTPVPAGHDRFPRELFEEVAGDYIPEKLNLEIFENGELNMTHLGLKFSGYINGVARKHSRVSREMFPGHDIESITNGIHAAYWTSPAMQRLFDEYIPEWREDPFSLRAALKIPDEKIRVAHDAAKEILVEEVNRRTGLGFHPARFTIGFARRFVEYKRPDLIFHNLEKLKSIADELGDIQVIFSGKAHPDDAAGKNLIKKIIGIAKKLDSRGSRVRIAFLENYNMDIAKLMVSGCDVWLNNPRRPYEASGTSGMKAAINGIPHFSTLDGWWLEGHIEDATGWCIGLHPMDPNFDEDISPNDEAEDFYRKLRQKVIPKFYSDRKGWNMMMRMCIAVNASFFNTHRMVQQYAIDAYFR